MEELLELIESLDYSKLRYAEIMEVIRMLEDRISMYDKASKQLKTKKDDIKEIVRLRMIDEGLEKADTDLGILKPTSQACLTMVNFDFFLDWLRDGVIEDIKYAAYKEGYETPIGYTIERYHNGSKVNDRLDYLKQACFNAKKLKAMHDDPEDTLPPGIGIFEKHDLSITKPSKTKKGAKKNV